MRFYCISDLHGELSGLKPDSSDVVLVAGDFAELKRLDKWGIHDQKKWIEKKFIPYVQSYQKTKFVIVPGNHDLALDKSMQIRYPDLSWKIDWPENVSILIDSMIDLDGIRIYCTPWVPIISHRWAFEADHSTLTEKFSQIPENIDILITHTPPRIPNEYFDVSLFYGSDSEKFGSPELTYVILDKKPKYLLCGHIHTGMHETRIFESTRIRNVSYLNEQYTPEYQPFLLEI